MILISKIYKALIFDTKFYTELEFDRSNLSHALLVVLLVGLCGGIGTLNIASASILKEIIFILIGWLIWGFVIYIIGVKILHHTSDLVELLVYLGFAYSPGIINIFGIIPQLTYIILVISLLWTILTFIYATKHALNSNYSSAIIVCIISVIPYIIIRFVILIL